MSSNDIFEAAASGDLEFLKKNTPLINQKNERNWTPLHFAARYGQLEVAKFLKEKGADITAVNSENKTAAQVAKVWGNESVAKLLDVQEPVKDSPFPENQVAVFAGSPLNRFGWKRNDHAFLASKARAESSKYLVLNSLQAMYNTEGSIQYLSYSDVASAVDRVYLQDSAVPNNSDTTLVFLGMDERQKEESAAYWALDITPKGAYEQEYTKLIQELESKGFEFCPTLPRAFSMDKEASSILAQAAAMVDWNVRNAYCSGCGKRTVSVEAGYKRHCVPDNAAQECISHKGVQNITYPRTDPVIIVCIIHPNGDKILLGRMKKWPPKMYSCIAGFVEAAESLEEAVRREAFEETGIIVNRVAYHSSQPWPFPNSLMLGFIAEAVSTEINYADDELEEAAWFSRSEVMSALNKDPTASFSMPPKGALAYTLIDAWMNDRRWNPTVAKM